MLLLDWWNHNYYKLLEPNFTQIINTSNKPSLNKMSTNNNMRNKSSQKENNNKKIEKKPDYYPNKYNNNENNKLKDFLSNFVKNKSSIYPIIKGTKKGKTKFADI